MMLGDEIKRVEVACLGLSLHATILYYKFISTARIIKYHNNNTEHASIGKYNFGPKVRKIREDKNR